MTDSTGGVGIDIAGDKQITRRLLGEAGVPVVPGGAASTAERAVRLLHEFGAPVVVKPRHGRQGEHVALNLCTPGEVEQAFTAAGGDVVVERQLSGRDYRVLVVAGEIVAAAERIAAHVVGDGERTVAELVAADQRRPAPRRGTRPRADPARIDDVATRLLDRQGCTLDTVPAAGQEVWLRENANLSTGGTSRDVTDRVHPDVRRLCLRVAALVGPGRRGHRPAAAGHRRAAAAVRRPGAITGGVIEVNAVPGLRMHLAPVQGRPRDVGDAIVRAMFPCGSDGRIPTVAVTGTNGKTSVARLTAHLLAGTGLRVGLTCTEGVSIDGRLIHRGGRDRTAFRADGARRPRRPGGRAGDRAGRHAAPRSRLRLDRRRRDHQRSPPTTSARTASTRWRTSPTSRRWSPSGSGTAARWCSTPTTRGYGVWSTGPGSVRTASGSSGSASTRGNPVLCGHLARGGTAYLLQDGWLVQATGARRTPLLRLAELPGAYGGAAPYMAANALAAVAAARVLGASQDVVIERLTEFDPAAHNPGRGMLLRRDEVSVFVDYAHNPAALAAVLRTLHRLWGPDRCVAAVTLPGDRRDDLITASAQVLADGVARAVLYDDEDPRGRAPGEVSALVEREMRGRRPKLRAVRADGYRAAIEAALDSPPRAMWSW